MSGFAVHWISETKSTNSQILELARSSDRPVVLIADHQTEGRGQFGRKWESQSGENLLFSIFFRPQLPPADAPQLTAVACRAVITVLTECGISCMIKPPNDVLVNGKKICGILTESSSTGSNLDYVVVGIGLNVNGSRETLLSEATSVYLETKTVQNRQKILNKILNAFEKEVSSHFSTEFDRLVGK